MVAEQPFLIPRLVGALSVGTYDVETDAAPGVPAVVLVVAASHFSEYWPFDVMPTSTVSVTWDGV
jgi:hypothetical protein